MRYKYRTIDLRTIKGIKSAERLQRYGWRIISVGFNTVLMEKEIKAAIKH